MQNRSTCGFVGAAARRQGIITPKPPLVRLRVCTAHAPVLAHRALRTLNHAKTQEVRFCCGRCAASCIICPVGECEPQAKHELSGIDTVFLSEHERYAKCELRNMV